MTTKQRAGRFPSIVVALVLFSGCVVGPDYEPPLVEVPDVWREASTARVVDGEAPLQTWWTVFEDPTLASLIDRAQASNLDLQQAVWRMEEARAARGFARGELLPGVRATGEKVRVSGMSDGTCDQLYLALRLASIEQRLGDTEPMPLILDDILINFDDDRARSALRLIADISAGTQVIFFTHHRHLVRIAESCLDADTLFTYALDDPPIAPPS